MVREIEGHKDHVNLRSGITFAECCKAVARLDGNKFNGDNHRFYTSLRVSVAICNLSYCDDQEKKKDGCAAWKDLVKYYYKSINDEKKIKNNKKKTRYKYYFK